MCHGQAGVVSIASISGNAAPFGLEQRGVFRIGNPDAPPDRFRLEAIDEAEARARLLGALRQRESFREIRRSW